MTLLGRAVKSCVGLGVKAAQCHLGVTLLSCVSNVTAFLLEAPWDIPVSRVSHFPASWFGEPSSAAQSGDETASI